MMHFLLLAKSRKDICYDLNTSTEKEVAYTMRNFIETPLILYGTQGGRFFVWEIAGEWIFAGKERSYP